MSIPSRNSKPEHAVSGRRTFFVTTSAWGHRNLLQADRTARLLIDVIYHYRREQKYRLHAWVIMPDHLHLLISVGSDLSVERAVQLVKGGFSYRATREVGLSSELWQKGFSEARIFTADEFRGRVVYINENPVRRGLAQAPQEYRYGSAFRGYELDCSPFAIVNAATSSG